MSGKRTTLSDIAKAVGVSVNTVSHALHNKPDISDAMKAKIREKAKEMGYIRNSAAGSMRSGRSRCLSVIVGDIANPHFSIMIKEIEIKAREAGYAVFVLNTNEDEVLEKEAILTSLSRNVDGVIICPVQKSEENVHFLMESGVPFTLIGRYFEKLDTDYVVCDDVNSGRLAASYLLEKGHRDIAIFMAPSYISSAKERLTGIREAFSSSGISLQEEDVFVVSPSSMSGVFSAAFSQKQYTAAICFSDLLALSALAEAGEKTPDIISFDNIQSKFSMPFSFRSITSSKTKMSQKAVEILLGKIENPRKEKQKIILPTEIIL